MDEHPGPGAPLAPARADERRFDEEGRAREAWPVLRDEARRLQQRLGGRVELEELEGLAHPALVELIRSYDPARGSFARYARLKLRWAMLDGVRRQTHGRTAAARALALRASERLAAAHRERLLVVGRPDQDPSQARESLRSLLRGHACALAVGLVAAAGDLATAADPGEDPEQVCARVAAARQLRAAVQELPERQRMLVERHYFAEQRFDHIAAELGISKSRASRLHGEAIRTLAERLQPEREADT